MFQDIIEGLKKIGHIVTELSSIGSTITGIARRDGKVHAYSDQRRFGVTAGF